MTTVLNKRHLQIAEGTSRGVLPFDATVSPRLTNFMFAPLDHIPFTNRGCVGPQPVLKTWVTDHALENPWVRDP